jgi:hypothetical protein
MKKIFNLQLSEQTKETILVATIMATIIILCVVL